MAAAALATAGFFGAVGRGAAWALAAAGGGVTGFGAGAAEAAAGGVAGSVPMMLTGGIEAALGKSIVVGRPVGPLVGASVDDIGAATAATAGAGAAAAPPHADA